jgi:hypothetical protein
LRGILWMCAILLWSRWSESRHSSKWHRRNQLATWTRENSTQVAGIIWGTLDTEPWQLDLLYFLALGWVLVPHFRRGTDKHNGLRAAGPNLTESAKENGAR